MARHAEDQREQIQLNTRERLLHAAAEEFAAEGYNGANINRISKAAGFAKGTIYNYFDSKRALMLALIEQAGGQHVAFISQAVLAKGTPKARLMRFFEAGFDFVTHHLPPSWVMVNNLYGHDEEFKVKMFEVYSPLFELLAKEVIASGIEAGQFRAVEPQSTAAILMTVYLGSSSQINNEGQPWLQAEQVAEFALNALRK